jgi:hypothetical protein
MYSICIIVHSRLLQTSRSTYVPRPPRCPIPLWKSTNYPSPQCTWSDHRSTGRKSIVHIASMYLACMHGPLSERCERISGLRVAHPLTLSVRSVARCETDSEHQIRTYDLVADAFGCGRQGEIGGVVRRLSVVPCEWAFRILGTI